MKEGLGGLVNNEERTMSDVMLFGVLRMPYELAMSTEFSRRQFYERTQEAANEIERVRADGQSRGMFVARLEKMQKTGDKWLTAESVLALLNDCDMLAQRATV